MLIFLINLRNISRRSFYRNSSTLLTVGNFDVGFTLRHQSILIAGMTISRL